MMPDDLGYYDAEVEKMIKEVSKKKPAKIKRSKKKVRTSASKESMPPSNTIIFGSNPDGNPYRDSIASLHGKRTHLLSELREVDERIRDREAVVIPHITSGPSRIERWLNGLGWRLINRNRRLSFNCPDEKDCAHRDGLLCDIDCVIDREKAKIDKLSEKELIAKRILDDMKLDS